MICCRSRSTRSDSADAVSSSRRAVSVCSRCTWAGIDARRRRAVEILHRALARDPAVADAQPDMEAGEMVGRAGLAEAGGQEAGHVGAAVRPGAHAHLGHLVEGVIGRLAEHVGLRLAAELAEEVVHPLHLALHEVVAQVLGDRRHVEIERHVALALLHRHRPRDGRHVGLVGPVGVVGGHEALRLWRWSSARLPGWRR